MFLPVKASVKAFFFKPKKLEKQKTEKQKSLDEVTNGVFGWVAAESVADRISSCATIRS